MSEQLVLSIQELSHIPVFEPQSAQDVVNDGVSDLYVHYLFAEDYEPGVEGQFFEEVFEAAVHEYERATGTALEDSQKDEAREHIKTDFCAELAQYGFDEPLSDIDEGEK